MLCASFQTDFILLCISQELFVQVALGILVTDNCWADGGFNWARGCDLCLLKVYAVSPFSKNTAPNETSQFSTGDVNLNMVGNGILFSPSFWILSPVTKIKMVFSVSECSKSTSPHCVPFVVYCVSSPKMLLDTNWHACWQSQQNSSWRNRSGEWNIFLP